MTTPKLRPAVRGLVIDNDNCVLLVKLVFPNGSWWVLPGGGIDDGEDHLDALHRELLEETGLQSPTIGGCVWNRVHQFNMTDTDGVQWDGQTESVYLVQTERFIPAPSFSTEELERENLFEHKWWTLSELLTYDGPDNLSPPDLASYLHVIIRNGIPHTPFEIFHSS
jgi:8-oxo-dGTP pyrophosphatase MutT (NUDIX family)